MAAAILGLIIRFDSLQQYVIAAAVQVEGFGRLVDMNGLISYEAQTYARLYDYGVDCRIGLLLEALSDLSENCGNALSCGCLSRIASQLLDGRCAALVVEVALGGVLTLGQG